MKKISLLTALIISIASFATGETIVQNFNTAEISPGSFGNASLDTFSVNQFNTSLGTLTKVTFSISATTWGGLFTVLNTTSENTPVTGNMTQGISASLSDSGSLVPVMAELSDTQTKPFNLLTTGATDSLIGPDSNSRRSAGPVTGEVTSGLASYGGSGTYDVDFNSWQANTHDASGSISGTFESAFSQGYLTVTYEYTPVPEPGSLALLIIGCVALGLRRRKGLTK